jgi:hypothetical protein
MPRLLKCLPGESESDHSRRVKLYLLAQGSEKFGSIAELIDPDDHH